MSPPSDDQVAAGRRQAGDGVAQSGLPAHSCARSRKDFTQHQLFAALTPRQFFKTAYRGVVAILADLRDAPG